MREEPRQLSLFETDTDEPAVRPPRPADRAPEARPVDPETEWLRRLAAAPDLATLEAIVKTCHRCPLRAGCTQVVFGEGHPRAALMLVGEGPGQVEDETGRPFVGPAGQLLDRMLAAIGLARQDVYIANVVKCRPPHNRVPTPEEAAACWPNLRRQIELVRPRIILCLGATAARQLVEPRASVSAMRGRWWVRDGVRYLVTFHPAALLRDPSKKRLAWQDLQMVRQALDEGAEAAG
ncbi:uracil-DNA glycosylase [Geochorda subterranea]|uniref:Type-4 uracil-DNA glycosylase n=1 Tax=Geochorda subterranea TaxID=3109564 RepID=A0ABZ1BM62_9FIRM|nr:uracil-DNA glycosylase [Limnochorda sp. LNt]WRP13237.1 uracil-DNA glycosylase [Limnochorda sp. LNt]